MELPKIKYDTFIDRAKVFGKTVDMSNDELKKAFRKEAVNQNLFGVCDTSYDCYSSKVSEEVCVVYYHNDRSVIILYNSMRHWKNNLYETHVVKEERSGGQVFREVIDAYHEEVNFEILDAETGKVIMEGASW